MTDISRFAQTGQATWTRSVALLGLCMAMGLGLLTGCADRPLRTPNVSDTLRADLQPPSSAKPAAVPARISDALAEPAPPAMRLAPEPRLDLLVNKAQAREVFLAIVADTRYSMLMHPDVAGTLSVTLRGVTVLEALESIRDVYGYDFKIDGRRITIYAPTLQTRIFTINYPNSPREGKSVLRVASGAALQSSTAGSAAASTAAATGGQSSEGNHITTNSKTDFWAELAGAVRGLVGIADNSSAGAIAIGRSGTTGSAAITQSGQGRSVIISPQAGIMAVRAMPDELREVDKFLKAAQIAVERQVMLEAKIVEVVLSDSFQSGIDWSALKNGGGSTGAMGVLSGNAISNTLVSGVQSNLPGFVAGTALASGVSLPAAGTGLFGLAFATDGFQAVLGFLETRGDVQILSSPRIATLNNQKAVLKVGSEDFFVTNLTPGVAATTTGTSTSVTQPTPTLAQFFSGISLDVTPQIDEGNNIMLHVHPSVTKVTEKNMTINNGTSSPFVLPLASTSVNESDTLVRIQDGHIAAIGGLMQVESSRSSSGLTGTSDIPVLASIFGNRSTNGRKKEVVVLIKPSIIRTAQDWEAQTQRTRAALDDMDITRSRVIRLDSSVDGVTSRGLSK